MGKEVFLTLDDPGGDKGVFFTVRSPKILILRHLGPLDGRKLYPISILCTLHGAYPRLLEKATSGRVIPLAGRTIKKCHWVCGVLFGLLDRRCGCNRNIRFRQEVRRDFQKDYPPYPAPLGTLQSPPGRLQMWVRWRNQFPPPGSMEATATSISASETVGGADICGAMMARGSG